MTAFFAILFLMAGTLTAQVITPVKRSDNKIVLEGKIYYVHVVKRGHTLYSIAQAYNVSVKEIIIENPGASSDLLVGQVLKIPSDPGTAFQVDTGKINQEQRKYVLPEGETLYAVSRKFNCAIEVILQLNPDLDINNIPVGTSILLPPEEIEQNKLSFDEEGFLFHKVKRGETLYSIARYYDISVKEIRLVNTELGWGGPRSGDVLRIPQPNTTNDELFIQDTTIIDSTRMEADSILEVEPYNYCELLDERSDSEKMYRIAYLIPFNYSEMEPLDSLLKDVKSAIRRERIREAYLLEQANPKSVNFLEFLEGSLLAIDSLTDAGMKLDVHVYDTKKSMYTTEQILKREELKNMDLIIGPFYAYNLKMVSEFSSQYMIPLVTPFHSDDSLLYENPYIFQPVPSYKTEYKRNSSYIARSFDSNLILVHDGDSSKRDKIETYKRFLFEELKSYSVQESVLFKEVIIADGNTDGLIHSLNPDCKNIIILPATDEAFASQVASRIFYELEKFDIELFGSPYWVGFNDIEVSYIHALKLIVSLTNWYDYSDPDLLNFLKKYRKNYYKEPGNLTRRGANFGVVGYDLSLYFLSALNRFGSGFVFHLDDCQVNETVCKYKFERISPSGGYENTMMHYYFFDENLNVQEVDLPPEPQLPDYLKPAGDDPIYFHWSEPQQDTISDL